MPTTWTPDLLPPISAFRLSIHSRIPFRLPFISRYCFRPLLSLTHFHLGRRPQIFLHLFEQSLLGHILSRGLPYVTFTQKAGEGHECQKLTGKHNINLSRLRDNGSLNTKNYVDVLCKSPNCVSLNAESSSFLGVLSIPT